MDDLVDNTANNSVEDDASTSEPSAVTEPEGSDEAEISQPEDISVEEAVEKDDVARDDEFPEVTPKSFRKFIKKADDAEIQRILDEIRAGKDRQHWEDLARRTQAEADNQAKRLERNFQQRAKYANEGLVKELMVPMDNIKRSLDAADDNTDFDALKEGVGMTYNTLLKALERFGVEPVTCGKGDDFDPEFHEAVMTGQEEGLENDQVIDCFEQGWKLYDRVLRPAKVRVNKNA